MKTKGNPPKDRRITIRLDNDTYQALEEAVENGEIENVSAALRQLIKWRTQSHELKKVAAKEDISFFSEFKGEFEKHASSLLLSLSPKEREEIKQDGFFHSIFLAAADLVRELMIKELYKRK